MHGHDAGRDDDAKHDARLGVILGVLWHVPSICETVL